MTIKIGTNECPCSLIITSFFLLFLASSTSSQNTKCPFNHLYHLGDGLSDIGNSIRILPQGPSLPAARLPYGETFPGSPTGRWSDGKINSDYIAEDVGLPNITAYLSMKRSENYDGVIFSVARSTTLGREFYASRGVNIPPSVASLRTQLQWFKTYLRSICSTPADCAKLLQDSLVVFGDEEGNDIGYPLSQDKSIQEVKGYVPYVIREIIEAAREVVKMGATRVVIPGNVPVGCYPYILIALGRSNPFAYDALGCLRSVNDLTRSRNKDLEQAVKNLSMEFPNATILYGDIYTLVQTVIAKAPFSGMRPLKTCCGIGGRYNFDPKRFCGSPGVPVCSNPNQSIFWDGTHFTQEAYARLGRLLALVFLPLLKCTY